MYCQQCFTRRKHYASHSLIHTLQAGSSSHSHTRCGTNGRVHSRTITCTTICASHSPRHGRRRAEDTCVSHALSTYIPFSLSSSLSKLADRSANLQTGRIGWRVDRLETTLNTETTQPGRQGQSPHPHNTILMARYAKTECMQH